MSMTRINGIDVDAISETVDKIRHDPKKARFTLKTETEWIEGCLACTTIKRGKYGDPGAKKFVIESDEPRSLQGRDTAPNAAEFVLHGLSSCLVVGVAIRAAVSGIKIEDLKIDLEADIDLRNFFGISKEVRPGFGGVRAKCRMKSDASPEDIEALFREVVKRSAVMDVIENEVPVAFEVEVESEDPNSA